LRLLVALAFALVAAAHLLLPVEPLREAGSIDPALFRLILVELRLPRTLLVLGYGAALGCSGAALQAMFANPLASPDISGASSGAALGAVLGGYWLGITQPLALAICGAAGALGTLALLMLLAGRRSDTTTLLLAGLAISLAAGAAPADTGGAAAGVEAGGAAGLTDSSRFHIADASRCGRTCARAARRGHLGKGSGTKPGQYRHRTKCLSSPFVAEG